MSCECIVQVVAGMPNCSDGSWNRYRDIVLTIDWCILTDHPFGDDKLC